MKIQWFRRERQSGTADVTPAAEPSGEQPINRARRQLGKQLLVGIPAGMVAWAATQPEVVEAGVDGDWTLTGNALPDATKFIGTTNAQPLNIRTSNVLRMIVNAAGRVGINTAAPVGRLHVVATEANGIRGETSSAGASAAGVFGRASSATGNTRGVVGTTLSPTGVGVLGSAPNDIQSATDAVGVRGTASIGVAGSGQYMGVQGSSVNYGVFGYTTTDSQGMGVYGRGGIGVMGRSYKGNAVFGDTDSGVGVKGESSSDGGSVKAIYGIGYGANNTGVVGEANNGTNAWGVWGKSTNGFAGYFSGKVEVTGVLSKGGGSFKIDHPLDPENKYLSHSFVESPDMMNIYNGNVVTDANGNATVKLPSYFEALNRDFRYQLTVIGQFAQAVVATLVANNQFTIRTDKPRVEVSWQVTGIRKDAWANENRIPVEETKSTAERGKYLHPRAFGKPETLDVQHERISALAAEQAQKRATEPQVPQRQSVEPE